MAHRIPVPVTKVQNFANSHIDVDVSISCFPDERVEYSAVFRRSLPGIRYKIQASAIFYVKGRATNRSRQATFCSYKSGVEGVPSGAGPLTGYSYPSESQIHEVDDFEIAGGILRVK